MADKNDHLSKARHNEEFLRTFDLKTTPYIDWAVIVIFYASIHYLEAYLADKVIHPANHAERNRHVRDLFSKRVFRKYQLIYSYAEDARYFLKAFNPTDVSQNLIKAFNDFKDEITSRLT